MDAERLDRTFPAYRLQVRILSSTVADRMAGFDHAGQQ
jgi:hypothetical protein